MKSIAFPDRTEPLLREQAAGRAGALISPFPASLPLMAADAAVAPGELHSLTLAQEPRSSPHRRD